MRRLRANPINVLAACALLVLVVLAGQAVLGATTIGVSIDEPAHVERFRGWLAHGFYMPDSVLVDGRPDPADPRASPYVYGAAFSAVSHLANVAVGNEAIAEISTSSNAYAIRRVVVALMGIAAAGAVGLAVRAMTRDRLAALWAAAALLAIPAWVGFSMFDVKDIPAGAGYTLVTAGLVIALAGVGEDGAPHRRRLTAGGLVAVGVFLGVGTRPALWLPLGISLIAFVALSYLLLDAARRGRRPPAAPMLGFAAGLVAVGALHPEVARTPIDWLTGSVSDSSQYPQEGYLLAAGSYLETADLPPWYLPTSLLGGLPLLVVGIAVLGLGVYARRALAPLRRSGAASAPDAGAVAVALVVLQLALLPAAASLADSSGGLRHHLYVLPAVAMLSGLGAARLMSWARETPRSSARGWVAVAALGLALVVPAVEQTRLYPYNYVYVNPLAGIRGVQGEWETEGGWISSREAFQRVPHGVDLGCSPYLVPSHGPPREPLITDCGEFLAPYRHELGKDAASAAGPREVWVVGRTRSANRPPDYCREAGNVTRPLRGEDVVMSYVLRCTPPPGELATSPAGLRSAGSPAG